MGLGLVYCWWTWRARNDLVFNDKRWATKVVSGKAQANFHEFLKANEKVSSTMSREQSLDTSNWKCPEEGMVKINVDATVLKDLNMVGTGVIARGADGVILGVSIKTHVGISSSRLAEALAIRDGLYMDLALNLSKVIVESDAEAIVKSCVATGDEDSSQGYCCSSP